MIPQSRYLYNNFTLNFNDETYIHKYMHARARAHTHAHTHTRTCTRAHTHYYQHATKWLASDDNNNPLSSPSQFFYIDMGKYTDLDSNLYIQLTSWCFLVFIPKVNNFCISTSSLLLLISIRDGESDGRTGQYCKLCTHACVCILLRILKLSSQKRNLHIPVNFSSS